MATQGANNGNQRAGENGDNKCKLPWYWIVGLAALGLAMLMGFPLLALKITQSKCCFFELDSLSSLLTFWGAVFAGSIALFGMLITGVFIITAFRVDQQAKLETRVIVGEVAEKEFKKISKES